MGEAARLREAGDSALLLEVGEGVNETVNARAIGIAAALRRRALPGVRDVVPTFRSVAVHFDPLGTDVGELAAALHAACDDPGRSQDDTRLIEVPVVYGGSDGPDIDDVAQGARLSRESVAERHASRDYRVYMLGFLPGFAYMASVDERIAVPRRPAPRVRVPAGSVGIAGRQTGIYPLESPGGWQIVGRTTLRVFDPGSASPFLFSPGDRVRFVRERRAAPPDRESGAVRRTPDGTPGGRHITILRPGLMTTVQDSGRRGYQAFGVPVAGAMDALAHGLANLLVGNPRDAAALEITLLGPEIRLEHETAVAITGADLQPAIDGADAPMNTAIPCRPGSVLRFGERRRGARAYLAVDGGLALPPVLGSRSTHLRSRLGGIEGRAGRAGDRIPLGAPGGPPLRRRTVDSGVTTVEGGACLRILPGPQVSHFGATALEALQGIRFTVSADSDRMGYRLATGSPVPRAEAPEMVSDAAFLGAIQIPPSGAPILLMADHQTTGGYPQIAIVITADVPLAAQLAPGDWVEFRLCTRAAAVTALIDRERRLLAVG